MENKEDRRIYTLSQDPPARAVIKMSIPLIFGMFIMVLMRKQFLILRKAMTSLFESHTYNY